MNIYIQTYSKITSAFTNDYSTLMRNMVFSPYAHNIKSEDYYLTAYRDPWSSRARICGATISYFENQQS